MDSSAPFSQGFSSRSTASMGKERSIDRREPLFGKFPADGQLRSGRSDRIFILSIRSGGGMTPFLRRVMLLVCGTALIAAETGCLGRDLVAAVLRMRGEHFFYENDLVRSWRGYDRARRWGGRSVEIDLDMV